jgi:hypothetical protein
MNYLLVKEQNKFKLYCPEIFGVETWGSHRQTSLEKKRKYWYINYWTAGNDYTDDSEESCRLNVVLETSNLKEVLKYVSKETKNNRAAIESILVQAQNLYHDQVAFTSWAASRK